MSEKKRDKDPLRPTKDRDHDDHSRIEKKDHGNLQDVTDWIKPPRPDNDEKKRENR